MKIAQQLQQVVYECNQKGCVLLGYYGTTCGCAASAFLTNSQDVSAIVFDSSRKDSKSLFSDDSNNQWLIADKRGAGFYLLV